MCDVVSEVQIKQIKAMIPASEEIGGCAGQPYENPTICVESTSEEYVQDRFLQVRIHLTFLLFSCGSYTYYRSSFLSYFAMR